MLETLRDGLDRLCVFGHVRNDAVFAALNAFLHEPEAKRYSALFAAMLECGAFCRMKAYTEELLLCGDSPFARAAEQEEPNEYLVAAAQSDISVLMDMARLSAQTLLAMIPEGGEGLPVWEDRSEFKILPDVSLLIAQYRKNGTGLFARGRQFLWDEGRLITVTRLDPIRLSDFVGYELQRGAVVDNTKRLLAGLPANNVLLYGDRGTGKSSTVKAIGNEFGDEGLRIIELPKNQMTDFGKMINSIGRSACKFIIFIDDLAFGDNEGDYTALKALLEGGLSAKPDNAVIYATSNRRNLIKETFRDRQGLASDNADEEVHARDNMQEKLSLADRFGLRVTFSSPGQKEFFQIVLSMARRRGVELPEEELFRRARIWALENNGLSPRTARQFVDSL